jgi:hypothetical protein
MTDREIKKAQSDKLFEMSLLKKAKADRREKMIDNIILKTKASMTAEEVSHVEKMVEAAHDE